jgi:hypothetical protein
MTVGVGEPAPPVPVEADGSARLATFIIDPDGILRAADADDALSILRALRSDERVLRLAA